MRRRWIVGIRLDRASPAYQGGDDGFINLIAELTSRVEGDLAYALVPSEPLLEVLTRLKFSEPLHLVVPQESATTDLVAGSLWAGRFQNVVSVNVQPGRGDSDKDW